jgi:hypothetical protein
MPVTPDGLEYEPEFLELDPHKVYVALVPLRALPYLQMVDYPKNVVAGFAKETIEFVQLEALVDRLGYRIVEKDDPRYK